MLQPAAYLYLSAIARRCGHLSGRQKLPHQCRDDREVLRTAFEEKHRRIRRQCSQTAARASRRTKEGRAANKDRQSVGSGKRETVRVDSDGRRTIKIQNKKK